MKMKVKVKMKMKMKTRVQEKTQEREEGGRWRREGANLSEKDVVDFKKHPRLVVFHLKLYPADRNLVRQPPAARGR
eukprot:291778-Hanusia_phi.AAC.1